MHELVEALSDVSLDDDIRALILTGAREKAFCAGADVDIMPAGGDVK